MYNVEQYLADCLDSIAAQDLHDHEVLVVDDESQDGSRAIAERHAAADGRIRILTRQNGGVGAARNTGVAHARGEFLTFVDSDDLLPPHALGTLVRSATATGSDIVVGAVERFSGSRSWRPGWVERVHAVPRRGLTAEEFLPLLRNLYTWNKLFRRSFWDEQGLWFREGVAYEDQPIITQLFARARSIDVIEEVVYRYRAREDTSSISQQTARVSDLRDRISAWRVSRETLRRETSPTLYAGWLQTLFDVHFHWYLTSPGTVDDTYWAELQAAVLELTSDAPRGVWEATPPAERVAIELTRRNRRADLQELVRRGAGELERWRSAVVAEGVVLELPFADDPDLDRGLFLMRPEQLSLAHVVEVLRWGGDSEGAGGSLEISGWAFLAKVDLSEHLSQVEVVLRSETTGAEQAYPASSGKADSSYGPPLDDRWCDYGPGSFHADVPVAALVAGAEPGATWEVRLRVTAAGFTRSEPVTRVLRSGSAAVVPALDLGAGRRLQVLWRHHARLRLTLVSSAVSATAVELDGRTLSGTLTGAAVADLSSVVVWQGAREAQAPVVHTADGTARFRVELPVVERPSVQAPVLWHVEATSSDDAVHHLAYGGPPVLRVDGGVVLEAHPSRNGDLAMREWAVRAVAEEVCVEPDGVLHVRGRVLGDSVEQAALVARSKRTRSVGSPCAVVDGSFEAELPLTYEAFRYGVHPLPAGDHDVTVSVTSSDGRCDDVPLRLSPPLAEAVPLQVRTDVHEGRLVRGPSGMLRLTLVRPVGEARGRYQRQRLLEDVRRRPRRLHRSLLIRSYFGEHATDSGVAVQQELRRRGSDLPVYWAVQDHSVPVPAGGHPVVVNTREWFERLASATYYLDNMYQPDYHVKPDGQVIVQTFHGYPFKAMGLPHWRKQQFSQERIDAYLRRSAEWDYLVSPARYATPLLRSDFGYQGATLEIGYPRNDVLLSSDSEEVRAVTRRCLGLADDQTAVLYAPTFRDYLAHDDNRARMADLFDIEAAAAALGEGFVILVRGHAFNARTRERVRVRANTVDVTDYPEVSDLHLAADVAVVDYSSLRFDFGVTGKPMVFHVPDLQRYQETRGWLFDFEPTAPGPLVQSTEEVVAALRDLDDVRSRHAERYAEFRATYLDLEDGHAASRLVDAVFAPRGDA